MRCAFLLFVDEDEDEDDEDDEDEGEGGEEEEDSRGESERLIRFGGFEGDTERERERGEAEVLEELTARWRRVPRRAFGLRDGVRPPVNAAGVQCGAYYGEGWD